LNDSRTQSEPGASRFDTPSTRFLDAHGIAYVMHDYEYVSEPGKVGLHAAAGIGMDQGRVFKTLLAEIDKKQVVCAAIPVHHRVDLNRLAAVFGGTKARMLPPDRAEALTGFQVGGISPFGGRASLPVVFDASLAGLDRLYINGGGRGLVVELAPEDALRCVQGVLAEISIPPG
jgi:Cys-tRNA(Pro)/Cys-tRNA(Cys) deacylase